MSCEHNYQSFYDFQQEGFNKCFRCYLRFLGSWTDAVDGVVILLSILRWWRHNEITVMCSKVFIGVCLCCFNSIALLTCWVDLVYFSRAYGCKKIFKRWSQYLAYFLNAIKNRLITPCNFASNFVFFCFFLPWGCKLPNCIHNFTLHVEILCASVFFTI